MFKSAFYIYLLSGNKLTGTVPKELCQLNLNEVFFRDNGVDELQYSEEEIQERDGCNSIACPPGYHSVRKSRRDGVFPCIKCGTGSINPYLGSKKCYSNSQDEILSMLSLEHGSTPSCEGDGIVCNSQGNITSITLPGVGLSGEIPEELGFLPFLKELDLSDNMLSGPLPSSLR